MKLYTDEEIKGMAGHPDCINAYEINGFLRGFRKAQELDVLDVCMDTVNSNIQYSVSGMPFMYPHLEEDKIFNTNYDEIEKYAKEHQVVEYGDFGTPKNDNYPEFTFEYDGDIHPTSYDFTFKNAFFRYCWV